MIGVEHVGLGFFDLTPFHSQGMVRSKECSPALGGDKIDRGHDFHNQREESLHWEIKTLVSRKQAWVEASSWRFPWNFFAVRVPAASEAAGHKLPC